MVPSFTAYVIHGTPVGSGWFLIWRRTHPAQSPNTRGGCRIQTLSSVCHFTRMHFVVLFQRKRVPSNLPRSRCRHIFGSEVKKHASPRPSALLPLTKTRAALALPLPPTPPPPSAGAAPNRPHQQQQRRRRQRKRKRGGGRRGGRGVPESNVVRVPQERQRRQQR